MGKKKSDEGGEKGKRSNKEGKKDKKLSVSAMLASMDQKPYKATSSSTHDSLRSKPPPKSQCYADIDLPPSDNEDEDDQEGGIKKPRKKERANDKNLEITITDKKLKKREKEEIIIAKAAEQVKQEALKDVCNAFRVVIGGRAAVLDGQNDADANVKDITVENFSVSVDGKDLFKNTTVKISHGKRYGLVGPNGQGKSTLLKLLAWRKIPVPKNIDVLLVEQAVAGDDRTALEVVVSANEELVKLRQEVATLLESPEGENGNEVEDGGDSTGQKLAELYDKLQIMGSDAAEAQASKILAGLGFTKAMQMRATRSHSGGWRMRVSLARGLFVQPTLLTGRQLGL